MQSPEQEQEPGTWDMESLHPPQIPLNGSGNMACNGDTVYSKL